MDLDVCDKDSEQKGKYKLYADEQRKAEYSDVDVGDHVLVRQEKVVHCRCSKCYSIPVRKRVRKRTPDLTLLSLPEEVLLCILRCLSAEELLAIRAVHSQLRDIVDNHSSVWAKVSFRDTWPAPNTVWLFERAADKGNFEAAVKLGIAYLYNEGPLLSDEARAEVCGRKASHFLCLAESLRPPMTDPFIWVFIRPPWSPTGSFCKAMVFDRLKAECDVNVEKKGPLLHCLARVLQLFDDDEKRSEALPMLEESSQAGCLQSSYLLWEHNRKAAMSDPGRYLQCVRTLRDYAAKGCWEAQVALAKICSSGNPLGLEARACTDLVAQLFNSSTPVPRHRAEEILRHGIKDTMRYILVDWLVEVTTMKDFSSLTLHVTVGCVDRYLALRSVPKARLQLLGIACMVVCTRYISKDILTIREAVWLTDNTYKYEDLVRMMGEVISVLEGKIRTPTLLDYGEVLLSLLPMEKRSTHLFSYICELSLLYSALSIPPRAKLACAVLLLTRALHHYAPVWPSQLVDNTGFSKQDLVRLAVLLHIKCFCQDVPKDYRHVSLTGVKQRFEDEAYQYISKEKVMDFKDLCQILEIPEVEPQMEPSSPTSQQTDIHTFLSSPSSNNKRRRDDSMQVHRGSFVATPTAELSTQEETLVGDILDWSLDTSCSGYEGDQEESEGEKADETSFMAIKLHQLTKADTGFEHCRALSSDEESFCEAERGEVIMEGQGSGWSQPDEPSFSADLHSSGYSSVQSASPSSTCSSSTLMPCTFKAIAAAVNTESGNTEPGFRLLVPMQRPGGPFCKQVKRKNAAAHSAGEMEREEEHSASAGFISL
ncbi:cyclin-F [Lampris incognitus]|uniref:cyclin-F n=1 Tax=Lampris incognitus TaxID=2546036 RepID=UPI0024B5127F|nr:cyclin-F [Lampris incognitus]